MQDKLLIYPYQRIGEASRSVKNVNRSRIFRPGKKLDLNLQSILAKAANHFNSLLTLDRLLPAVLIIIMSRAFVLGELLPFVYACLTAFGYRDRTRSVLLTGCAMFGLITVLSGLNLGSALFTLLIMLGVINYVRIPAAKAWWGLPLMAIAVIFISKTLFMFFGSVSLYQQMVITFEALISGVLTFVFLVAADALKQRKPLADFSFEDIAAFIVVGTGIIMGLTGVNLGGLSVAAILCRLGILVAALLWGSSGGTMVGVMAGIIPSISSSIFAQSLGVYAVSGFLAGLFRSFGRLGVIIGYMLGTLALSMFITDTQATILGMWETGIASLLFMLLPASLKEKIPTHSLGIVSNFKGKEKSNTDLYCRDTALDRIENLAGVFEELSSTFAGENNCRKRDDSAYLTYLYDEISATYCNTCSRYEECWVKNCYTTSQEILDIFSITESNKQVTYEECPVSFRRRCIYGREMLGTINHLYDNLRINEYWASKIRETRGMVSRQLQGVSQVMKKLAQEMDDKIVVDFGLRHQIFKESKKRGLEIRDISPIRSGEKQLIIKTIMPACVEGCACESQAAPIISGILGENMEVCDKKCPRITGVGQCEFTLTRAFNYRVVSGAAQVGKEEVCGDSFTIATLKEGKELVALSDGMGVGEKACNESQAAVRLLESLLSTGFDRETALETINSVLILRSTDESFATLDLLMIDLYNAEIDFIKVGSAPTFIKRGKKVGVVTSNSIPIGILDNLDIVTEKRSLFPHDVLVMVSDGVLEAARDGSGELWLKEFLVDVDEKDPQHLAEMIINKALALCNGKPRDDMTVICMNIELN